MTWYFLMCEMQFLHTPNTPGREQSSSRKKLATGVAAAKNEHDKFSVATQRHLSLTTYQPHHHNARHARNLERPPTLAQLIQTPEELSTLVQPRQNLLHPKPEGSSTLAQPAQTTAPSYLKWLHPDDDLFHH